MSGLLLQSPDLWTEVIRRPLDPSALTDRAARTFTATASFVKTSGEKVYRSGWRRPQ